jgi:hypothetical protein
MKFYAVFKQGGEGCDYTIGCGIACKEVEARDIEEAKKKVTDMGDDPHDPSLGYYGNDAGIFEIILIPVDQATVIDTQAYYDAAEEQRKEEKRLATELREREQLEQLKKKYEK